MIRMRLALSVMLVLAAVLAQSAPASARGGQPREQRPARILAKIAAHQTHGFRQDAVPLEDLEAQLAAGGRIVVSCGTVAELGVRAALRAGYTARLVGSYTRQPLNGDDGHVMMELRLREGWTVFDLDNNRMAPPGVGISELVRNPRWRLIATDFPYDRADLTAAPNGKRYIWDFKHLGAWYDRVLGVPLIYADDTWWFHDASDQTLMLETGHQLAPDDYWLALNG